MWDGRAAVNSSMASTSWVNVPGASADITTLEGGLVRVRFAGESLCGGNDPSAGDKCRARDDHGRLRDPEPDVGGGLRLRQLRRACCGDLTPAAHAMEWLSVPLPAGTYTVQLQAAVGNANITFTLDDWTFTAEGIDP